MKSDDSAARASGAPPATPRRRRTGVASSGPGFSYVLPGPADEGPKKRRRRGAPDGSQNRLKLYPDRPISILQAIKGCARIGCTKEELAAFLDISESTLHEHFDKNPEYVKAWEYGRLQAKVSLRHLQWWHAQRDNASGVAMTIHMSKQKQWLDEAEGAIFAGARENQGGTTLGGGGALLHVSDDELSALIRVRERVGEQLALAGSAAGRKGTKEG